MKTPKKTTNTTITRDQLPHNEPEEQIGIAVGMADADHVGNGSATNMSICGGPEIFALNVIAPSQGLTNVYMTANQIDDMIVTLTRWRSAKHGTKPV